LKSLTVIPKDGLYEAEFSTLDRKWRTPHPMRSNDLARTLLSLGCSPLEIAAEFRRVGIVSYSGYYERLAKEAVPRIKDVLAGGADIQPKSAFEEAWIALVLFLANAPLSIEGIIELADLIEHAIPESDEIAWALLQLQKRGWLTIAGDTYFLTVDGRRMIESVLKIGKDSGQIRRLEEWFEAHPSPGGS